MKKKMNKVFMVCLAATAMTAGNVGFGICAGTYWRDYL